MKISISESLSRETNMEHLLFAGHFTSIAPQKSCNKILRQSLISLSCKRVKLCSKKTHYYQMSQPGLKAVCLGIKTVLFALSQIALSSQPCVLLFLCFSCSLGQMVNSLAAGILSYLYLNPLQSISWYLAHNKCSTFVELT